MCCDFVPPWPVCGCDSVTYGNACEAQSYHGINYYYNGSCAITGINEVYGVSMVSLIPNPTVVNTQLKFNLLQPAVTGISICDVYGKTVVETTTETLFAGEHTAQLNLENLSDGMYLMQLKINNRIAASRKLLKVQTGNR